MNNSSNLEKRILELRRRYKSYKEIAEILGISKSTVSYWMINNSESQIIKNKLIALNITKSKKRIRKIIKASQEKWRVWREIARKEAIKNFNTLYQNPLFIAGIIIYWGEGDSNPKNPLRISNTDPRMIKLYVYFLKEILSTPEEKIKLGLILYPDLSDKKCKTFWKKITTLKEKNFVKTQYIKGYHPTKRLSNGICMVVVNSRQYKIKILQWIDLFSKQFTI